MEMSAGHCERLAYMTGRPNVYVQFSYKAGVIKTRDERLETRKRHPMSSLVGHKDVLLDISSATRAKKKALNGWQ